MTTNKLASWVFYCGLACLFTHELDAMTHHEWQLLPGLNLLSDKLGAFWFVLLHVPLFAIVMGFIASTRLKLRSIARIVVAAFLMIHAGLHWAFSYQPDYTFNPAISLSHSLIYAAAVLGSLYLVITFLGRSSHDQYNSE